MKYYFLKMINIVITSSLFIVMLLYTPTNINFSVSLSIINLSHPSLISLLSFLKCNNYILDVPELFFIRNN